MKKDDKTNVMRLLDQHKIPYVFHYYADTDAVNGPDIVRVLNQDPDRAFKTLVTVGKSGRFYVFVIPISRELDLTKAASAAGEKNIEMIKSKELLPLTGYIHGGCSPIGMKKFFPTFVDRSALNFETFMFSAGKIGYQVEIAPSDLGKIIRAEFADISTDAQPDSAAK